MVAKKMKQSWDAIVWWEWRRIIFNVAVGLCGFISIGVIECIGGRYVKPGQDVVEPFLIIIGVVLYGLAANLFYTFGWLSEVIWSEGETTRTKNVRPRVFYLGLGFSCFITLVPAVLLPIAWAIWGFK